MNNEQFIWNYLKNKGLTDAGAAGLMGNLYAESGLNPINLQNTFEKKLGYTDDSYTKAVDSGKYKNFVKDKAGYGLCQWTYWSRKEKLLNFAKEKNKSIGDLQTQLDFLFVELNAGYGSLLNLLKTTKVVKEASNGVLLQFERPADQSVAVQEKRASYGSGFYFKYAGTKGEQEVSVNITKQTSNHNTSAKSNRKLEYIVIHYTAGTRSTAGSALNTAKYFANTTAQASADFIVDDITIVQYNPDIKNRYTWHCGGKKQSNYGGTYFNKCTNSNSIGIEVCSTNKTGKVTYANDPNWYFTDAAVNKTLDLVKYLMKTYNIDADHVIRHFDVTGKYCPGIIGWNSATGNETKWKNFKAALKGTSTQPVAPNIEEEEEVTQEQFNKMMNNWIAEQAKKDPSAWSAESREWAERNGFVSGDADGKKMYKKVLTREEVIAVLYRALHRNIVD